MQYRCLCDREFLKLGSLKTHKRFCLLWRTFGIPKRKNILSSKERKSTPIECPICTKMFANIYKMSAHKGHCVGNKSRTDHLEQWWGWNRGLTKETSIGVARSALATSKRMKGKSGRKTSSETKRKQSIARQKYLETHPNNGVSWYDVQCGTEIKKVQGAWEKKVADWLNTNNIRWERTKLKFCNYRQYTPDFYLPEQNFYIEVKGFWRDRDIHKMYLVLDENNVDIRYVDKTNLSSLNLDLPRFVERFKRSEIDFSKFRNIWSGDGMADN